MPRFTVLIADDEPVARRRLVQDEHVARGLAAQYAAVRAQHLHDMAIADGRAQERDAELGQRVGSVRFTAYTMIVSTVPAIIQFSMLEAPAALQLPAQLWWIALALAFNYAFYLYGVEKFGAEVGQFDDNPPWILRRENGGVGLEAVADSDPLDFSQGWCQRVIPTAASSCYSRA